MKKTTVFSTEVYTFTPEEARFVLDKLNPSNRHVRTTHVNKLATDMKNGDWQFNGDTIAFDQEGHLIDGQHRLAACVQSGVDLVTLVVWGLEHEVIRTKDDNIRRSFGDFLKLQHKVPNATSVAVVTRSVFQFQFDAGAWRTHGRLATAQRIPTNAELERFFLKHKLVLIDTGRVCGTAYSSMTPPVKRSYIDLVAFACLANDRRDLLDAYLLDLKTPGGSQATDALVKVLVNQLTSNRYQRYSVVGQRGIGLTAFHRWVQNDNVSILRPPKTKTWVIVDEAGNQLLPLKGQ